VGVLTLNSVSPLVNVKAGWAVGDSRCRRCLHCWLNGRRSSVADDDSNFGSVGVLISNLQFGGMLLGNTYFWMY
jgi:hypothetical protein